MGSKNEREGRYQKQQRVIYPFAAISGQDDLRLALLLHAVNPRLGGILIKGEKGTAKSTAVRGLSALLPDMAVVAGCTYHCDPYDVAQMCVECKAASEREIFTIPVPVIDLPVSATEDRVVGSLDFETALKLGRKAFAPGLMGEANRGIIYVDEINLLDDHIVDVLLDAASSGINVIEREGISVTHPAEFILAGTMNPEEGDLRPQLLDRFALCVEIQGMKSPAKRVEIIKRREAFDLDSVAFIAEWEEAQEKLREQIQVARQLLPTVQLPEQFFEKISVLCQEAYVAGHRADVVLVRAAMTLAAWRGHALVTEEDIDDMAPLVLLHRRREPPEESEQPQEQEQQEQPPEDQQEQDEPPEDQENQQQSPPPPPPDEEQEEQQEQENKEDTEKDQDNPSDAAQEIVYGVGQPYTTKRLSHDKDRQLRRGSGRRSRTQTDAKMGRYIKSTSKRERDDLAIDATIRAAAPFQRQRMRKGVSLVIETSDIREKVREKRIGNFMLFLVDASGSMGARQRMVETKGAILSLLLDAYQKRDRVGMIAFKGDQAEVILPATNSVEMAQKCLVELPTGGKTPLAAGLSKALEVVTQHLKKNPHMRPMLIVLSDGKGNVAIDGGKPMQEARLVAEMLRDEVAVKCLVIDTEKKNLLSFGLTKELAQQLGGEYYTIDQLKADNLVDLVRGSLA